MGDHIKIVKPYVWVQGSTGWLLVHQVELNAVQAQNGTEAESEAFLLQLINY